MQPVTINGIPVNPPCESESGLPQGEITCSVQSCSRCGDEHSLIYKPLANAPGPWTHFAICPETKQPIISAFVADGRVCCPRCAQEVPATV